MHQDRNVKRNNSASVYTLLVHTIVILFFVSLSLVPLIASAATSTDSVDITLTVTEAAAPPPAPPGTGGGGPPGGVKTLLITNVEVLTQLESAIISWETNRPALGILSYGTTTEYTLGILSETSLLRKHEVLLDLLTPNTRYFFRIEVIR